MIIIVVGGLGSTTGAILAAAGFTLAGEWLRIVEEPTTIFGHTIPGIPGMRMVILSLALLLVIIFCRRGLMGRREFSWAGLGRLCGAGAPVRRPAPGNHKDPMALLHTEHLDMRFGGLSALEDLNLSVPEGGLYGLIGPNGAGKTTVFNLISGFLKPTGGRIVWDGRGDHRGAPAPPHGLGDRPDLSEHPALRRTQRPCQRPGGVSLPQPRHLG